MSFLDELQWRGLLDNSTPGIEDLLSDQQVSGYIGVDPTASSLHVGNLATLMLLVHFQKAGHQPIALVGGATGMIGDPSGKDEERSLLSEEEIRSNQQNITRQVERFLNLEGDQNAVEVVNNLDWYREMNWLTFLRDVGKHLTLNYMMNKESVKNRLEQGISFAEFSYQLMQAYDFYWLHENQDCKLQMGGSDQWGNMTAGVELIRRKTGKEAYAITTPLMTKPDGSKLGKTEEGNIWLDPELTSPYEFYQFWINISDEEASRYIRTFTLKSKEEIEALEKEHEEAPYKRKLQKELAKDVTIRVHSRQDFEFALKATRILFGKETTEALKSLSEDELLQIFEGVPQYTVSSSAIENGNTVIPFLADEAKVFSSRGKVRRSIKESALRINKQKVQDKDRSIGKEDLLNEKYILVQKGKKNYNLVVVEE